MTISSNTTLIISSKYLVSINIIFKINNLIFITITIISNHYITIYLIIIILYTRMNIKTKRMCTTIIQRISTIPLIYFISMNHITTNLYISPRPIRIKHTITNKQISIPSSKLNTSIISYTNI